MWFKQAQLFQFTTRLSASLEGLTEKLMPFLFKPCPPSMPFSIGWAPLLDEEMAPMVRSINGCLLFCLQVEERILPAAVIREALFEKIKKIESLENRKVYQKEKLSLKDEVIITLLPKAFTKSTRFYAYIDTKNQWLILNTTNTKKTELFLNLLKKSLHTEIHAFAVKNIAELLTQWVKHQHYPATFGIEKSCVLQDSRQQKRIIRLSAARFICAQYSIIN